jgi:raffinose/stachyose/melibiose transport system substrate-binding protein
VASAKAVIAAFQAANPNITVQARHTPGGSEGDNLVKTRLSTGEMAEVFIYNNGSLLQAIKAGAESHPAGRPAVGGQIDPLFAASSKGSDGKIYGGPYGTAFGGGVLYNIPVYKKLSLQIPKTWDEFMKNNETIKKAGIDPVEQTYGETWTSQLFVLGDYHNVEAQVPDFAQKYTAGQAKYATTPAALAGWQHIQDVKDAGYFNKDFASAKLNDGVKAVATGTAAHYPQLGATANNIENVSPGKSNDVGFFALPGPDAATNGMTVWPGTAAMYIPKSVEGDKLEAAKKFIAFAATKEGCDAYSTGSPPQGPYLSKACQLPAEVSQVAKDTQATSNPVRRARRWSSSHRSRARLWSRSASRWAPVRWTPRRAPNSTTRMSRSRRSSWVCPAGSELTASPGCLSFVTPPAAGLDRDRQQDLKKGAPLWRAQWAQRRRPPSHRSSRRPPEGKSVKGPIRIGSIFLPRSSTRYFSSFLPSPPSTSPSPDGTCSPRPGSA